jgi:mycothiol synthase
MSVTIRNYQPGDAASIVDLYNAAEAVDKTERGFTLEELGSLAASPLIKPEADIFLAFVGDALAGVNILETWTGTPDSHRVTVMGVVHPAHRQHQVGTQLMQVAETRSAEIMRGLPTSKPAHYMDVWSRNFQRANIKLFERLGFTPARYFCGMQRSLSLPVPEPTTPEGFTIRTYRPEDNKPLLDAFNEAFRDHWGSGDMPLDLWEHELVGVPHFRPELWFLATDGDEIAGFTLCAIDPSYIERVGRKEGIVMEVGTRRPWRKRGLASALINHGLAALKQAGMDSALLGVDADSPTGAFSLYERLGFKEIRRNIVFRKSLN